MDVCEIERSRPSKKIMTFVLMSRRFKARSCSHRDALDKSIYFKPGWIVVGSLVSLISIMINRFMNPYTV